MFRLARQILLKSVKPTFSQRVSLAKPKGFRPRFDLLESRLVPYVPPIDYAVTGKALGSIVTLYGYDGSSQTQVADHLNADGNAAAYFASPPDPGNSVNTNAAYYLWPVTVELADGYEYLAHNPNIAIGYPRWNGGGSDPVYDAVTFTVQSRVNVGDFLSCGPSLAPQPAPGNDNTTPDSGVTVNDPVRSSDGQVEQEETDLSSDGFGMPWSQTRSWSNTPGNAVSYGQRNGRGWVNTMTPVLRKLSDDLISIATSGKETTVFRRYNNVWYSNLSQQNTLVNSSGEWTLTDGSGTKFVYYDDSSSTPSGREGKLKKVVTRSGQEANVISYSSAGDITKVRLESGSLRDDWDFTYQELIDPGIPLLTSVVHHRSTDGGTTTTALQSVEYDYYGWNQSHGNPYDLRSAVVRNGGLTADVIRTSYYRYYKSGEANGYEHGLKFVVTSDSFDKIKTAYSVNLSTIQTVSDANLATYADQYYEYAVPNEDYRPKVTKRVTQGDGCSTCTGGFGTFTYSYMIRYNGYGTLDGDLNDPNSWYYKTTLTKPDGNTEVTYSNARDQVMLKDVHETSTNRSWVTFTRYDNAGRVLFESDVANVTGYNDSYLDLVNFQSGNAQYLSDTDGKITVYSYATSTTATDTTAGNVNGYLVSTAIKHGETDSTAGLISSQKYFSRTVNGTTVYDKASLTIYPNDDTTTIGDSSGLTTNYSYQWFAGDAALSPQMITTTLPAVATNHNGSGTGNASTSVMDVLGQVIWQKDAAGFLTYTEYDPLTGSPVKVISDVNTALTSDFADLPSGWTTPSGGGLHLKTLFTLDQYGRITQTTYPNGRIDYMTYDDVKSEVRTYRGWSSGHATMPVEVTRRDRTGGWVTVGTNSYVYGYSEVLTMQPTSISVDGSGRPTGTEAVSNIQTMSRSYDNQSGQVVLKTDYLDFDGLTYLSSGQPAFTFGTSNTNFYETKYSFDTMGRQNRVTTPAGTISRTDFDFLGRAVASWVGTVDGSSGNMVQMTGNEYDNAGIGDGNLTKITEYPGGSAVNRVTEYYYDWRNQLVATKSGVESSESTTVNRPISYKNYDNLGRVTMTRMYDGDGVTITSTGGVPNAPSSSLLRAQSTTSYDELSRVYLSEVYSVDPSTGAVSTNTLKSNTWFDSRGLVIKASSPGGLVQKTAFDGVGRAKTSYTSDGGGDTGYSDATNVTGDKVLEQSETAYDASGNVLSTTTRQRFHDETGTGALGTPTTGNHARVSYVAYYYDAADRLTDTADFGTNSGANWTRPSSPVSSLSSWASSPRNDFYPDTQGSWHGVYGSDGYVIAGGVGTSLPSTITVNTNETSEYTWTSSTSDSKALQKPAPSTDRAATTYYDSNSFTIDVAIASGYTYQAALYFVDWPYGSGRDVQIDILDAATGTVLSSDEVDNMYYGTWRRWDISGHVKIRVTNLSSTSNAVLSAIMFDDAESTPSVSLSPALVTHYDYDSAGRQWKTTDPKGIESRKYYDALGRTTTTIENFVDGVIGKDNDKTTEYTYSAAGMTSMTSLLTGAVVDQTTEWVYGVTTGTGSAINSNDIVGETHWPDPSTGSASSSQKDVVTINALGQTLTSTDRNGTVHTLGYDVLGRVTNDTVTTLGTNIDGAVRRVDTAYDGQGNAYQLTNYDAASGGSIVNQVQRAFNGLGQMTTEWQAHGSAVNTSTSPKVQYAYSEMAGGANHSRPTSMTYPNGREIDFNYGVALDDSISRLSALNDGSTTLESYDYLGLGTVVKRSHPESGVDLSYVKQTSESVGDAGDQYTGLDRFGRVVDQRWLTASTGVAVDRYQYSYDRNINRTSRFNSLNSSLNETYSYDNLNQLTGFGTSGTTKSWDYDALGNWNGVTTNGSTQTRTANAQNEITSVSGATTPTYDASGNMTTDETGKQYVYDAWNRLVKVKDSGGTTIATYVYDAITRRVSETAGSVTTDLYYSSQWQVLEERIGGNAAKSYVWSPVYVDALLARDRDTDANGSLDERLYVTQDANFNVTGLVNTSGTAVERFTYDPYGTATIRDGSWSTTTDAYVWQYLHQGGRLSEQSGLYSFRNREYSPTLGRFISIDPLGYGSGDRNLYAFTRNNPITNTDPSGLLPWAVAQYFWHWHHMLPQEIFNPDFINKFKLSIDPHSSEFGLLLQGKDHIGKDGIHPAGWNDEWKSWKNAMEKNGAITDADVKAQLEKMKNDENYKDILSKGKVTTEDFLSRKARLCQYRNMLKNDAKFAVVLGILFALPSIAEAGQQGGPKAAAAEAVRQGDRISYDLVNGTIIAGGTGAGILTAAELGGFSITMGGTAVAGISGATIVGGAAVSAGVIGYETGTYIGGTSIGGKTVSDHIADATVPRYIFGDENINTFQNRTQNFIGRFNNGLDRIGSWFK